MNSVEMFGTILASEEMQQYKGIGGISFPFVLEDGRPAAFLYVESNKKDMIELIGIFTQASEQCVFEEARWMPEDLSGDLLEEVMEPEEDFPPGEAWREAYLDALEELYTGFDCFAPMAFKDMDEMTQEQQRAVRVYLERIRQFSDPLKRACYLHCAGGFFEWCMQVYYAAMLME